jgi:hypothetical protein
MNKIINNDPYGGLICRWFATKFPKKIIVSKEDIVDILTELIFSTKENRYGPIPSPEHQVVIRDVIRRSVELNLPIPVLVPWGGRKTLVTSPRLDMAEVSGLYQIIDLDNIIKTYYSPGLTINIRVEDINADWIWRDDPNIKQITEQYSADFVKLVNILRGDTKMLAIRESQMMVSDDYMRLSQDLSVLIQALIEKQIRYPEVDVYSFPEFSELQSRGWKGEIPQEQRDYYLKRYESLYPGQKQTDYIRMLADYFGGSKARYDLDAKGEPRTAVGKFIQLTYTPPIPGSPASLFSNAVYWRTVPESQGRTHISPWRAKGYLKISGNEIKNKITSFGNEIISQLTPSITTLEGKNGETVDIDCDYIVEG